jgi:hypothetical protein
MKSFQAKKRVSVKGELNSKGEKDLSDFISSIPGEVAKFNESFDFDLRQIDEEPSRIDGERVAHGGIRFVLIRENRLLPEQTYCLYSLLRGRTLYGYIGIYRNNSITTVRELKPFSDFTRGGEVLYDWLRQLLHASCEKMIL